MDPIEIEITRVCEYKAKACKECDKAKTNVLHRKKNPVEGAHPYKRSIGCARCGEPRKARAHFGQPPSFNVLGSGNPGAYMGMKDQWQEILIELLLDAGAEPMESVMVEGEVTFPRENNSDQGNFRVIIEKALGDALVAAELLPDDTWDRYEFGNLQKRIEPGISRTRLILFPSTSRSPT